MKLKNKCGETIAESLVSVLVVAFAILFLSMAVITAARVNSKADHSQAALSSGAADSVEDAEVRISFEGENTDVPVKLYKTENGFYYYEYDETTATDEP